MVIHEYMPFIIVLLLAVLILVMLGERVKIAYPIFLVLSGLGLSMIPGVPHIQMDPELVFLIFLPTILYEAAWYTPWQDFYKYKRHISLLAFGLVIFTSLIRPDGANRRRARILGCAAFLAKPCSLRQLVNVVSRVHHGERGLEISTYDV